MKTTFQVESETGGVMLIDPTAVLSLGEEFAQCLNILFDPEGKTCVFLDYPDQTWSNVWQEAAQYLATLPEHNRLLLMLGCEGTIFVRIQDQLLSAEEEEWVMERFTHLISVPQKRLAVIDGMMFFDDGSISKRETVPLHHESQLLTIYHLSRHPSEEPAVGLFGSGKWPRIIVMLTSSSANADISSIPMSNIIKLNTAHWVTQPVSGAFCIATVTQIVDQLATLDLHLTSSTRSGHGRVYLPMKPNIKVHQNIVVKLEEDSGGYWSAKFVSRG